MKYLCSWGIDIFCKYKPVQGVIWRNIEDETIFDRPHHLRYASSNRFPFTIICCLLFSLREYFVIAFNCEIREMVKHSGYFLGWYLSFFLKNSPGLLLAFPEYSQDKNIMQLPEVQPTFPGVKCSDRLWIPSQRCSTRQLSHTGQMSL